MKTTLACVILNDNVLYEVPIPANDAVQKLSEDLARSNGGKFECPLGLIDVLINPGPGHAVISVKIDDKAAALSVFAWEDFNQKKLWADLAQQHCKMMKSFGVEIPELTEPSKLPWITISVAPSFMSSASESEIKGLVFALSAIASGLLAIQGEATTTN